MNLPMNHLIARTQFQWEGWNRTRILTMAAQGQALSIGSFRQACASVVATSAAEIQRTPMVTSLLGRPR